MVRWPRRGTIKTPRPASFVVGRLWMVLPEKFLLSDFVKLLGSKFVVPLMSQRVRRRIQLRHRILHWRDVEILNERRCFGTWRVRRQSIGQAQELKAAVILLGVCGRTQQRARPRSES